MKKEHILLLLILIISIVHVKAQPGFEWANYVGGFCDIWGGPSSAIDRSGNIYNTGAFSGTLDFDPGPGVFNLSANGTSDIIIRKTDTEGNFIWAKAIGSSISDVRWYDKGKSIAIDDSGFVYVAGVFYGTVDFDPGVDECYLTSNGKRDSFILKLSADGEFVWVRTIGGTLIDEVRSITGIISSVSMNLLLTYRFDLFEKYSQSHGIEYKDIYEALIINPTMFWTFLFLYFGVLFFILTKKSEKLQMQIHQNS